MYVSQQETSALLESGTLFLLLVESICTIYNRATQKAHVVLVRFQWTGEEPLRSSLAGQSGLNIHHLRLTQAHNWMEAFLKSRS
ncbi:hypothetical protein [Caldalkalibacillus thermarum]|uniref:hypothetical protein n=1 Tax=Caldalkalibacillus thermarum TaxID=296745 RepID=UPI0005B2888E|nr:hypothetical protein [Caldalkalibacillus thermarum]